MQQLPLLLFVSLTACVIATTLQPEIPQAELSTRYPKCYSPRPDTVRERVTQPLPHEVILDIFYAADADSSLMSALFLQHGIGAISAE